MSETKHLILAYCTDNRTVAGNITSDLAKVNYVLQQKGFNNSLDAGYLSEALRSVNEKVVMLITDNFLKSAGCLKDLLSTVQQLIAEDLLIPVVADGRIPKQDGSGWETISTSFDRVSNVIHYMNYWQDKYLELRRERRNHEDDEALEDRLETTRAISTEIGELLRLLRNRRCFQLDAFTGNAYEVFFRQIDDVESHLKLKTLSGADEPQQPTPQNQQSLIEIIQGSSSELMAENLELDQPEDKEALSEQISEDELSADELAAIPGMDLLNKAENVSLSPEAGPEIPELTEQEQTDGEKPDSEPTAAGEAEKPASAAAVSSFDDLSEFKETPTDSVDALLEELMAEEDDEEDIDLEYDDDSEEDEIDIDSIFEDDEPGETKTGEFSKQEKVIPKSKKMPTAEEALEVAINLFEAGHKDQGIGFLQGAVEGRPNDPTLRYYHAYALARYAQDFSEASQELETLLKMDRNYADAWFLLAELAEIQKDYPAAKSHFEKVAGIQPDYPDVNYRLGLLTLYHFEEKEEDARHFFQKAIEQDDKNTDAHYRLGTLYSEFLGQPENAVSHFNKVVQYYPNHPFANYDLALLHHQMGDPTSAQEFYLKAIEINPELKTPRNDAAFHVGNNLDPMEETEDIVQPPSSPTLKEAEEAEKEIPVSEIAGEIENAIETAIEQANISEIEPNVMEIPELPSLPTGMQEKLSETTELIKAIVPPSPDEIAAIIETPDAGPELEINTEQENTITQTTAEAQTIPSAPAPPVVLITGATAGIGKATAEVFAKNGYRVIITGRREERLTALKNELFERHNADILTMPFDVTDLNAVKEAIGNLPEEWKKVDILINNAGLSRGLAPIHEGDIEHWNTMIDTNIKGLLYLTRAISPHMVARRQGHIINISSGAGKEVYPNGNVYCATKFAVEGLTKAMRLDLFKHNIRVSQVAPGHVEETEFARVRFDGDTERAAQVYEGFQPLRSNDVAEVIYFMATRPPHVNIQDVLMFGTQQAGSNFIDRSGR